MLYLSVMVMMVVVTGICENANTDTAKSRATCNAWADDQRGVKQGDMSVRSTASTVGQS